MPKLDLFMYPWRLCLLQNLFPLAWGEIPQCHNDVIPTRKGIPQLSVRVSVLFRPPLKKVLFPVQWMAEIVASRAAAIFFFFFVKNIDFFGGKMKKTVPILQLYPHPAAGPETPLFLGVALAQALM